MKPSLTMAFAVRTFSPEKQRNAQGDGLPVGRKSSNFRAHLPYESEFQIAFNRRDGLKILPLVARFTGSGLLFQGEENLLLGHAVRADPAERPVRRLNSDPVGLELEGPCPFINVCQQPLDSHAMNTFGENYPKVAILAAYGDLWFVVDEHGNG